MAGQRTSSDWSADGVFFLIDDGTMCRAETPPPGPVLNEPNWSVPTARGGTADDLKKAVAQFRASDNWRSVQPIVYTVLGTRSFGLGVVVGLGENVIGGWIGLADVVKTLLLADLYDRAHGTWLTGLASPGLLLQQILAEVGMRAFSDTLTQAHKDREALIAELTYAVTHPGEVLGHIGADYAKKWKEFKELSGQARLTSQFQAGRIFGEVLADVLALIAAAGAAAKLASKIPRLAKLARLGRVAAPVEAKPPKAPFETPSRLRPVEPATAEPRLTPPPRATAPALTPAQNANLSRFKKSLPKGALETTVEDTPGGGKVFKSDVPGRVPGSKAVYEKVVDANGTTTKYLKTTYDPAGNIVHVKQKYP